MQAVGGGRAVSAWRSLGGARGNSLLTSLTAAVLLVLLAVEGATIPLIHQLLSLHVFLGVLLLGPVALKVASTGYRFGKLCSLAQSGEWCSRSTKRAFWSGSER